jgi:hypothetical protein
MKTQNPYSSRDSRFKWFHLGVLYVHDNSPRCFLNHLGTLPDHNSPNRIAFDLGKELGRNE